MKKHTLGVFLFGLATVISMTLLYGADLGRNWLEVSGSAAKEYRIPIRGSAVGGSAGGADTLTVPVRRTGARRSWRPWRKRG